MPHLPLHISMSKRCCKRTGVVMAVEADDACANSMNAKEGLSFWDLRLTARGPEAREPNWANTCAKVQRGLKKASRYEKDI